MDKDYINAHTYTILTTQKMIAHSNVATCNVIDNNCIMAKISTFHMLSIDFLSVDVCYTISSEALTWRSFHKFIIVNLYVDSLISPTMVQDTNNPTSVTLTPINSSSSNTTLMLTPSPSSILILTPTSPSSSSNIILIAAIIVILLAFIGAGVFFIVFPVVLLRKKNINNNSKGKTEPDYYNSKTEDGAESACASPQDDYYSTVNNNTSKTMDKNSRHAHAFEDLCNSKELESSQVYDDIDEDVKNKFIQPNGARDEAKDDIQIYSIVDMRAKKGKKNKQEKINDSDTLKSTEISDMYAVVDKKAKNKSQEECTVDEYAVVGKSAKKRRPEQKYAMNEYAIVDKSAKKRN